MAASSVNIYSPLSRLRRDNQTLLSQLKQGQNDTWDVLKRMRSVDDSFVTRTDGESSFTYRGADRTPASVTRRTDQGSTKAGQTSTPKNFQQALMSCGNDRRNKTSVVPVSILSTPGNRKKVSFQTNVHVRTCYFSYDYWVVWVSLHPSFSVRELEAERCPVSTFV